jgi:hypothetical protein
MRKRFWRHGPDDFRPYPPESAVPPRFGQAPQVIKPFTPYQSVVDRDENRVGDWIMTREAHRESLRRNNCIEMGTEKPDWMKEGDYIRSHGGTWEDVPDGRKESSDDPHVSFEWQNAPISVKASTAILTRFRQRQRSPP